MEERHGIWVLAGNDHQNAIVRRALDACDFPFELLIPEIQRQQGRDYIRVEWEDLSRYAAEAQAAPSRHHDDARSAGDHDHSHHEEPGGEIMHVHAERDGDKAHGIGFRNAVLGLAWYSLKITMHSGLSSNPNLGAEVFLAEGAHMIDFAYMSDLQRVAVYKAFHPIEQDLPEAIENIEDGVDYGHGHGWFDVGGYYSWVGEAFMGGFIRAFAPRIPVTIEFEHLATPQAGAEIRKALLPEPEPVPEPPAPEPEDDVANPPVEPPGGDDSSGGSANFFRAGRSRVFHDSHRGIRKTETFETFEEAEEKGLRPCQVCKPRKN